MKSAALFAALAVQVALAQEQSLCDQYSYWASNGYYFNNNEWNEAAGSGSNCIDVTDCYTTGTIFNVQWSWSGGDDSVKAYPSTGLTIATGQLIDSIGSMPTEVYWSYSGSDIRADVSYDLFTASDPSHDTSYGDYELMIWLAQAGGVDPLGEPTGAYPTIGGTEWQVWYGTNTGNGQQTYSFVVNDGSWLEAFDGDVMDFWNWLIDNEGFPGSSQYLLTYQFGTEPFTGSGCDFNVTWFTAAVN